MFFYYTHTHTHTSLLCLRSGGHAEQRHTSAHLHRDAYTHALWAALLLDIPKTGLCGDARLLNTEHTLSVTAGV